MNKKILSVKTFFFSCFLLALPVSLFGQTADGIEFFLQIKAVSYEQAAWLVLEAANVSVAYNRFSSDEAFRFAMEKGWLSSQAKPSESIKLREISLLIMRAFGIKGGPMYTIFKNPHYAYREMVYQEIIQGRADPGMTVSGELLLFLVNRVLFRMDDSPSNMPEEIWPEENPALVKEINDQLEDLDVPDVDVKVTDEGITISLSNMQFLANPEELEGREKEIIQGVGKILADALNRKILVAAYTVPETGEDHVQTSLRHAQAVADYLLQMGIREANGLVVRGYGSERPIADNNTPEGMNTNRRVEITILRAE